MSTRQPYPSDVTGDEWAFVAPYLSLMSEQALQRKQDLRELVYHRTWGEGRVALGQQTLSGFSMRVRISAYS